MTTTPTVQQPPSAITTPRTLLSRIGWLAVALTSLGIAAFAVTPYLTASLEALSGAESGGLAASYAGRPWFVLVAFYAHIVAGGIALVVGPFQFWRGLRTRHPLVHRSMGRVYLTAVAIAAVGGIAIAPISQAGLAGLFGFGALGVLWLVTGLRAYRSIRRGDVASHQAWMIRNFALTYAAVTLRLGLFTLILAQVPFSGGEFDFEAAFANAYVAMAFLAWLPNLLVAEWLVRRRGLPSYRLTAA
jgi:uncharacterized membrane protein